MDSKRSVLGPVVTQPERRVSITSFSSSTPISAFASGRNSAGVLPGASCIRTEHENGPRSVSSGGVVEWMLNALAGRDLAVR